LWIGTLGANSLQATISTISDTASVINQIQATLFYPIFIGVFQQALVLIAVNEIFIQATIPAFK
jgi:type II secretory pathway component PulF